MTISSFIGQILKKGIILNRCLVYKQTSSSFDASNNACLQNNGRKLLERNNKSVSL